MMGEFLPDALDSRGSEALANSGRNHDEQRQQIHLLASQIVSKEAEEHLRKSPCISAEARLQK